MHRRRFLKIAGLAALNTYAMNLSSLAHTGNSPRMPLLFVGHGSPMNAIENNSFTQQFSKVADNLPVPNAILCISAHWQTRELQLTAMPEPKTIHDFGGFPPALYQIEYPAPGMPDLAQQGRDLLQHFQAELNYDWGLDHGTWSVLRHMFPKADIPVVQLSLKLGQSPEYHYNLAKQLSSLRQRGVLIVGSGNIVHNLARVAWDKLNEAEYGFDWAYEANDFVKRHIESREHAALLNYRNQGSAMQMAVPTPEHYLPLLQILALQEKTEEAVFFNDSAVGGSLTMTSVLIR